MGSLPGMTVGMGATEEVAESMEEALLLIMSGWTIMMAVMDEMMIGMKATGNT